MVRKDEDWDDRDMLEHQVAYVLRMQRGVRIPQILLMTSCSTSEIQTLEVNPVGPPKVDLFVDSMLCIASMMDYFLSISKFNRDNSAFALTSFRLQRHVHLIGLL